MSKGTWPAIVGCVITLVGLGALVTWAESRLPRGLREDAAGVREALLEGKTMVHVLTSKIEHVLKTQGQFLGDTAKEEGWQDLVHLAAKDLDRGSARWDAEVKPILERNSREEEEALIGLLDELHEMRVKALRSVEDLEKRITELAQIVDRAAKAYEAAKGALAALETLAKGTKELIQTVRQKHPAVGKLADDQRWVAVCDAGLTAHEGLAKDLQALEPQLRKGTQEAAKQLLLDLNTLQQRRGSAQTPLATLRQRIEGLADFLDKKQQYVDQAKRDAQTIAQLPTKALAERAERAAGEYPWNAQEIRRRAGFLAYVERSGAQLAEQIARTADLPLERIDPQALYAESKRLAKLRADAPAQLRAFEVQLGQLDRLHEQVLTDMEVKDGYEVSFHQELLTLSGGKDLKVQSQRAWKKVSEAEYKRLEPYLGMCLLSKPLGYFDDQARKTTHAAGFPYVGGAAYGAWKGAPEGVWEFSPGGQALQAIFWGKCYQPIERSQLAAFEAARTVWLGSDRFGAALYGSQGSLTRQIYAQSKYVLNDGWKNTRYKKSGGTWKGTKYDPPPPSTRSTVVVGGYTSSSSGPRSRSSSSSSWSSSSSRRSSSSSSSYRGK
ncbi:MAG: hypothetical protein AB7N76_28085 [Planctomycetota bacterium]